PRRIGRSASPGDGWRRLTVVVLSDNSPRLSGESPDIMTKVHDLETPAVTIDLDRLEKNIARAQEMVAANGIKNRPHIKTHKIPEIARMQIAAGASGLTCQKLSEAEVFVDAGLDDDILITFNIVGE